MLKLCAFADEAAKEVGKQITALQRNRIGYIELRGLDGANIGDISLDDARAYAATFAQGGIRVWSVGSPIGKIGIGEDLDAHLEKLRHICHLAKIFGTTRIRMFSFFDAYAQEEKVLTELKRMVALAHEEGCELYHENEKKIFGDTLQRVETLMEKVPGLNFIYDPANFIEVGEAPEKTLPALAPKCAYFHIKDALMDSKEIVPAGLGDGLIGTLLENLPAQEDFTLTLEPHLKFFEGYNEIDGAGLKNKYHFKTAEEAFDGAVAALKKLILSSGYRECQGGYQKL